MKKPEWAKRPGLTFLLLKGMAEKFVVYSLSSTSLCVCVCVCVYVYVYVYVYFYVYVYVYVYVYIYVYVYVYVYVCLFLLVHALKVSTSNTPILDFFRLQGDKKQLKRRLKPYSGTIS